MPLKLIRIFFVWCLFLTLVKSSSLWADESDIIKADRQALAEANLTGISSKIFAAKEQLSDDLSIEAEQRHKDFEGITIPLVPDDQGHFLVDVLINNKIHASLIVDTGSPLVLLTSPMLQKLGLDISQSRRGYVEILNGKYKAAGVSLANVDLGGANAGAVDAAVLLEESPDIKDGLLGLSYLSKFHFTLDQKGQKLILRKLE